LQRLLKVPDQSEELLLFSSHYTQCHHSCMGVF